MIEKILFKIARGPLAGGVVGAGFKYLSPLIPVKKVFTSKKVIGFYHPKPSYEEHMLFVPKKPIRDLFQLSKEDNCLYFLDLWNAAQAVIKVDTGKVGCYVLCSNGGSRQDVKQVHFHLFKNKKLVNCYKDTYPRKVLYTLGNIEAVQHNHPNWETHIVMLPVGTIEDKELAEVMDISDYLQGAIKLLTKIDPLLLLKNKGYTLIYQVDNSGSDIPVLHIVSGKKLD